MIVWIVIGAVIGGALGAGVWTVQQRARRRAQDRRFERSLAGQMRRSQQARTRAEREHGVLSTSAAEHDRSVELPGQTDHFPAPPAGAHETTVEPTMDADSAEAREAHERLVARARERQREDEARRRRQLDSFDQQMLATGAAAFTSADLAGPDLSAIDSTPDSGGSDYGGGDSGSSFDGGGGGDFGGGGADGGY